MHDQLWVGIDLKIDNAQFHLNQMGQSLQPPAPTHHNIALQASGAILDTGWQRSLYAHLDAFLSAARSVPEIIQCCFGHDTHPLLRGWFNALPADEQQRRDDFRNQFKASYDTFRAIPLGIARHISEHRTGYAPVTVSISGRFGLTYIGGPAKRVPTSETRTIDDPALAWLSKPIPLQPSWTDFDIEGKPLFPACQEYIKGAQALVDEARGISDRVHGSNGLTTPEQ